MKSGFSTCSNNRKSFREGGKGVKSLYRMGVPLSGKAMLHF